MKSSKIFKGKSMMGGTPTRRNSAGGDGSVLTPQMKEIIEFDHRFDARIVSFAPGALPLAESVGDRPAAVVLKKYEMELVETKGVREEAIWRCTYHSIDAVAWDHQHSTFRVASSDAVDDAGAETYEISVGETEGPLGLNLVSSADDGPGSGCSAALENVSDVISRASGGRAQAGHLITSVHGQPTGGASFQETMAMLRSAPRPFNISLRAVNALPAGAGDDLGANYVTLAVGNSTELEQNLSIRIKAMLHESSSTRPPNISYMGIFSGPEKPKPFQRRRASLTADTTDALPSPQVMRRLSMSATRNRRTGIRRQLAIQHIHEGHNYFNVQLPGGGSSFLVVDYDGLQLVTNPTMRPLNPRWQTAWLDEDGEPLISQWQVQGDVVRVHVAASGRADESTQNFNMAVPGAAEAAGPMHLVHTMEFYMNSALIAAGRECVPGSTHGRDVLKVHTLLGAVDAQSTSSAKLAEQMARKAHSEVPASRSRRYSIGGTKPPWWSKLVRYQGWMLKKGGLTKQWQRRFFILYRTSQGSMLAYYSAVEHTPLHSQDQKERNLTELCMVTAIRPVSTNKDAPEFSFDIVGVDRDWTFGAESKEDMQVWLQLLSRAVDEDVAITPDDNLQFQVKPVSDPTGQLPKYDYTTMLKILAQGVQVCIGPEFQMQAFFWCYTDIHRWSVATHNNKPCLLMSVFLSDEFSNTQDFVFRTKESVRLSTAIEFYIEKFMSVMQLKEVSLSEGNDANTWEVRARPQRLRELPEETHAAIGDTLDDEADDEPQEAPDLLQMGSTDVPADNNP
eukprot:g7764.t1